jgi:Rab3 GTPase-activating protein catalytic subunit
VEEDAQVLLQLGTDAQGAEMRARMMSASLLSDMESFKVLLRREVIWAWVSND